MATIKLFSQNQYHVKVGDVVFFDLNETTQKYLISVKKPYHGSEYKKEYGLFSNEMHSSIIVQYLNNLMFLTFNKAGTYYIGKDPDEYSTHDFVWEIIVRDNSFTEWLNSHDVLLRLYTQLLEISFKKAKKHSIIFETDRTISFELTKITEKFMIFISSAKIMINVADNSELDYRGFIKCEIRNNKIFITFLTSGDYYIGSFDQTFIPHDDNPEYLLKVHIPWSVSRSLTNVFGWK